MSSARESVLLAIRTALGSDVGEGNRSRDLPSAGVPPTYRRLGTRSGEDLRSLFLSRVEDYEASVTRCSAAELSRTVAERLMDRGSRSLVVPADLPASWIAGVPPTAMEILQDDVSAVLSRRELATANGVMTGCFLAIAETGTLVLNGGSAQGRRALTLLPDYHLCVVFGDQIVETVPEAVAALGDDVREVGSPVTLISGPSATSDIELIRVEGVHGPRTLDVILVEDDP